MSIFRDTFKSEIAASINARQKAMRESNRTPEVLQYLNSRNAWIKMTSAVNVNGTADLAKNYVLSGGTLNSSGTFKSGLGSNSSNAYSTATPAGGNNRLGIRPMPGITNVDIKSKSAYGSLREAIVNFQCWDIKQLEDLEVLYMRPGYTVLLEWGWTPYLLEVNGALKTFYNFNDFYSNDFLNAGPLDRTVLFKRLYDTSVKYGGNYDAMYGYIKNYNWSAREDGGYDCQTTIISTGEIIESLKVNYVRPDLADFGMYDSGSIGHGYLDDLFTQGTYETSKLKEFYEKNTLTGIWAELYKRVSPRGTVVPFQSSPSINIDIARFDYPGLKTNEKEARIEGDNQKAIYITLPTFVNMMNYYIIARSDGGNKEPLVELSVNENTYSSKGDILKCIAHPLQISVDPTVCLIKNKVWSNILSATSGTVASVPVQNVKATAQSIVDDLVKASDFTVTIFNNPATDEDAFVAAIKRITNQIEYDYIHNEFKNGHPNNTANKKYTYANDGLKGLIEDEFKSSSGTGNTYGNSNDDKDIGADGVAAEIVNIYYLYLMKEHFVNTIGVKSFDIMLEDPSQAQSGMIPLNTILKNKNATMPNTGNADNDILALAKILGISRLAPAKSFYNLFYDSPYNVAAFPLDPPSQQATAATTIINNASTALDVINDINNSGMKPYFYNDDPNTEIAVLEGIYLNVDYLYRLSLSAGLEAQDGKEKNEINLYTYVKNVMRGVQTALGNVNNFELHVDPVDNKARIIDVNFAEPDKQATKLFELQVQNLDSIVRSYNLESKIFPNQSAIVAIGSQAQGGQLGIQNNTMIDWNKDLTDRTIPVKTFPTKKADPLQQQQQQQQYNLASSLASIIVLYASLKEDPNANGGSGTEGSDMASKAKNSLRDLIVYFQSITTSPSANRNLIPTKFSFEMDGIGGLVIGHLFTINQDILPKGYKYIGQPSSNSTLAQTIVGISHKLSNSDWTTNIDTNIMILDKKQSGFQNLNIAQIVQNAVNLIITGQGSNANANNGGGGGGGGGGTPPRGGSGNPQPGKVSFYSSPCGADVTSKGLNFRINGKVTNATFKNRNINTVTQIVIHNTEGWGSAEETICGMTKINPSVGYYTGVHYAVDRGGGICRGVPLDVSCNHGNNFNPHSVGIEISNLVKAEWLPTTKEWKWVRSKKYTLKADPNNDFYCPDVANIVRPKGYGGYISDLGFKWYGNQYYEDYTDIQMEALGEIIKEIVASCPNFRFNYQKGNQAEVYKNVFGMGNLRSNGAAVANAAYPDLPKPSSTAPGVFSHSRAPGGTHTDAHPSLKLISLLMKFGN